MPIKCPKLIFLAAFLLLSNAIFAQKDSIAFKIPTESDKVVYKGIVTVNGKSRVVLDTAAKTWLKVYFKYFRQATPADTQDTSAVFSQGMLEYKVRPGMVNIPFFCQVTIRVTCKDGSYTYRISDIYFRPQNEFLNNIGYENSPDYLVKIGKRKHLGLAISWNVTRDQIREYLTKMDANIRDCIASLNKAMNN
ncbi:MAG TPA: hypothetical protein VHS53_02230 [Mucilaginibacter sp.]|jgi:hypothetical protein|nr:hypothetical protein [Mucilaginibacter sp.]